MPVDVISTGTHTYIVSQNLKEKTCELLLNYQRGGNVKEIKCVLDKEVNSGSLHSA